MFGFAAYAFKHSLFFVKLPPYVKIKGYRMHNSEFTLHLNCGIDNPCFPFSFCIHQKCAFHSRAEHKERPGALT